MKLIALFGLMKISARNSFLSTTSPVLLVASHTTVKSVIPRLPCTSLKKGLTAFLKSFLVNSSLNSKSCAFAAIAIAFSSTINNLRTLILLNADSLDSKVLSPNNWVPFPGNVTTGFTPAWYKVSLWVLFGENPNLTTFLIWPLEAPAGENHASWS